MENTVKSVWRDGAVAGVVMGGALAVVFVAGVYLDRGLGFADFLILVGSLWYFGKRRAAQCPAETGFPYGRSVGYMAVMSMFAGVVMGFVTYLMYNFIVPDYWAAKVDEMVSAIESGFGAIMSGAEMDRSISMAVSLQTNPVFIVFSSVFNWVLSGVLVGLVVSAFVKKDPSPFAGGSSGE